MKVNICHPDKKHYASGLCETCYRKEHPRPNKVMAVCHPERRHVAKGLCSSCYQKAQPKNRTISTREKNLKCFYGITEAKYEEILAAQNDVCAICGLKQKEKRPLFVDHDHRCCPGVRSCGKCVRGIICTGCNTLVGFLESPNAPKALGYIEKFTELWRNR